MPNTDEQLARVARAIAKTDGLDWDEVCGYESGRDECDSSTCIAALLEDHDPDYARGFYSDHAQAAIAAMRDDWRPIETAPRDGRRFIAGRFSGEKKNHDGLIQVDRWHDRSRGDSYSGLGRFNHQFWPATHWMPLPAPPAGESV